MATIVKTPAESWKAVVRKQGWPNVAKTFRTKRDAEDWARQTEDEMVRGVYLRRTGAQKLTLSVALDRYLREVTPHKAQTTQRREIACAKHLRDQLGTYALAALTADIVGRYRDNRLAAGAAPDTVRLELAVLSNLFTVAIREWSVGLPANPVLLVRKPKGVQHDRRLEGDEKDRLLASVRAHSNPILGWVTELALETAARVEEILGLELRDIDLKRRIATFRKTKNGEIRSIPLTQRALEIFEAAIGGYPRGDSNLVFPGEPGRDGVRRPYRMNRTWRAALARAGIQKLRFHDLRHEATSKLVEYGLSDSKVRRITGHKTAQMLARYAHLRCEDLVHDLDRVQGVAGNSTPESSAIQDQSDGGRNRERPQSGKVVPFPQSLRK